MSDYPRMLYRKGNPQSPEYHGFHCDTLTVEDAEEEQFYSKSEGWRRTPAEAHGKEPEAIVPDTPEAKEIQDERDALASEVADLRADNDKLGGRIGELTAENEKLIAELKASEQERDALKAQAHAAARKPTENKPAETKPADKEVKV